MTRPAIELRGVSKRYWKIRERSLLRSIVPLGPPNRTELWALRGLNMRVDPGETAGIIGRNGAGPDRKGAGPIVNGGNRVATPVLRLTRRPEPLRR